MRSLYTNTEKCPLQIPLHPGAAKYYKEKGYLLVGTFWSLGSRVWRSLLTRDLKLETRNRESNRRTS